MRRFGPGSIIAVLCTAILFVVCTSPDREHVSAQQVEQAKIDIAALEKMKDKFIEYLETQQKNDGLVEDILDQQRQVNAKAAEADVLLADRMEELFSHIVKIKENLGEVQDKAKLTSTTAQSDVCTCGEKLAEFQSQLDELKARVASLEQAKTATSTTAATSSYGSVTQAAPASPGGSTGSTSAQSRLSAPGGGSTGSVKPGSVAGPGPSGYTYYTDPVTGWLMQCYNDGITSSVPLASGGGSTGSIAKSQYNTTPFSTTSTSVSASQGPHITVVSTPACNRCPAVIAQVQREYSPAGWTVDVESVPPAEGQSYPYYRVCVGSQCAEIHCDVSQLNDAVKSQLRQWGVSFGESQSTSSANVGVPAGAAAPGKRGFLQRQPVRSAFQNATAPVRAVGNVLSEWGTGRALEVARASAQYRAANRIKGHSQVDLQSGMSNGVGWSTANPQPATCFWNKRSQGAYASVQGADGTYYSTLVLY